MMMIMRKKKMKKIEKKIKIKTNVDNEQLKKMSQAQLKF